MASLCLQHLSNSDSYCFTVSIAALTTLILTGPDRPFKATSPQHNLDRPSVTQHPQSPGRALGSANRTDFPYPPLSLSWYRMQPVVLHLCSFPTPFQHVMQTTVEKYSVLVLTVFRTGKPPNANLFPLLNSLSISPRTPCQFAQLCK